MNDENYMKAAIKQAKKAYAAGEIPVGAVIVKDGKVIASAYNLIEKKKSALAHAELLAIKKAAEAFGDWRLNGCDMYVTLEPCPMCAGAIINSRITRLFFGASDDKGGSGYIFERDGYNHKTQCFPGVLENECLKILKDFFAERRKKTRACSRKTATFQR